MLICGCGRWMHTQSVDEMPEGTDGTAWLVRSECRECGRIIGCEAPSEEAESLVDRLMWSDDARHTLERMPPYVSPLVRHEVEDYVTSKGRRVVTQAL
ncbi:MAG TPA: PCP reductase family protein, partial [Nitrospiraceae bacterium]|nr:PCP reductase family protein [Nitrospiraceae bacterium]